MITLSKIKCCVIIPTYNNAKTLAKIIEGVLKYSTGGDVIVVNDGSTDNTAVILDAYKNKIIVLANSKNTGKGVALKIGFHEAIRLGFVYAISIDSDGQHFPDDIPKFISAAIENPDTLLMGSRNMNQKDIPGKSSFGNKFSNFWFWIETGLTLPDTQTGFRLYPLNPLKHIKLFTTKFETEIEVIVKLAWRNVKIISVPVNVLYDKAERVSHFRPFRDFSRISILNTYLVVLALLFYLPKRFFLSIHQKGLITIIKEEAIKSHESNFIKAASIGFGVFMGIIPIWGFQLLVGIPLAILFRMNKVLFIASANISIPPMIPLIIFLSYYAGGFFVENNVHFESIKHITMETIHINLQQYVVGAIVLAFCAGAIFFTFFYFVFFLTRTKIKNGLSA